MDWHAQVLNSLTPYLDIGSVAILLGFCWKLNVGFHRMYDGVSTSLEAIKSIEARLSDGDANFRDHHERLIRIETKLEHWLQ